MSLYIDIVLNIIYFGYKFDLKFRVLNWFWTWTEVQVWAEGALNWTELNFNSPIDDFEFEFPHILWEIVIIVDAGIGEPGGGFGGRVSA